MNRFKFRGWNEVTKKMISWNELINMNLSNIFVLPKTTGITLMQYTGLKDKNAKEIYEGDIVFIKGETELLDIKGKVEYSETFAQYIITNTGSIVDEAEPLGDYDEMTVIGNVWENSDLLKGE